MRRWGWVAVVLAAGCGKAGGEHETMDGGSEATDAGSSADGATSGVDGSGDDGDGGTDGGDDGPPAGPHALGTIALGESHPAAGGSVAPSVTAAFIPDATNLVDPNACADEVAGCFVVRTPECDACDTGEYCAFDDDCMPSCLPVCDASCADNEVCFFPSPGHADCKPREDFDAGILAFANTAIPITIVPPYAWSGDATGSPFLSNATLTVQASGAATNGFDAFEHDFSATSLLQTTIDDIALSEAYGDGPVPVRWVAGADEIEITLTAVDLDGISGTIVCPGDDASGAFDVPRMAIDAAIDGGTLSSLSLAVRRVRTEQFEGVATKGMLTGQTIQPEGWVVLSTWSMEQHTVEGCGFGETICNDECVDVLWDSNNCGDCDKPCDGSCENGECTGGDDSCAGICGAQAASGCWCNDLCVMYGDCCPDYETECTGA